MMSRAASFSNTPHSALRIPHFVVLLGAGWLFLAGLPAPAIAAASTTTFLVKSGDFWRYRKGTNAPPANWKTAPDSALDATWLSGPGGFGYGDADDMTILGDMINKYSTVYIRKSFVIASPLEARQRLWLAMDWDDGFIAWLDGVEIARSSNVTDAEPPYNAVSNPPDHEASGGDYLPNPSITNDLGWATNRLAPGTHVLALMGLNAAVNSIDLSLIANLFLSLEEPSVSVGGTLAANTVWSSALGEIRVTNSVLVPGGVTLSITAGAKVLIGSGLSIRALDGGTIHVAGGETNRVYLRPAGANPWGELSARGANSSLVVRQADISGGQTAVFDGATALLEDAFLHDYLPPTTLTLSNQPIMLARFAGSATIRRCHFQRFYQTRCQHTLLLVEDSLFESVEETALGVDAGSSGSIVRRCTFRHGCGGGGAGLEIKNDGASISSDILVESCLICDFPLGRGIFIGGAARNIGITNCLIYGNHCGASVADSATAGLFNSTLSHCETGFQVSEQTPGQGPGRLTNGFNNLLWYNTLDISALNIENVLLHHSNVQDTNWPGLGNFTSDPRLMNPAGHDYRLADNSPCRDSGYNGEPIGAHLPVGAPMATSNPSFDSATVSGGTLRLRFWADAEKSYIIQSSGEAGNRAWTNLADVPSPPLPRLIETTFPVSGSGQFFRLVAPTIP